MNVLLQKNCADNCENCARFVIDFSPTFIGLKSDEFKVDGIE
ncbi:MAG: hypothetical protein AB1349_08605 [Elusimicrobiota bacterium]